MNTLTSVLLLGVLVAGNAVITTRLLPGWSLPLNQLFA